MVGPHENPLGQSLYEVGKNPYPICHGHLVWGSNVWETYSASNTCPSEPGTSAVENDSDGV